MTKLQLAIDDLSYDDALSFVQKVQDFINIIELGSPFLMEYGMEAVRSFRNQFPNHEILADLKIMDAGYYEAELAFKAGADVLVVVSRICHCENPVKEAERLFTLLRNHADAKEDNMRETTYLTHIISELSEHVKLIDTIQLQQFSQSILSANHVFVAGAGRSGFIARAFANRLMHLGLNVYFVGDPTTPAIQTNDLLIINSGSGTTNSLMTMACKAKTIGAKIALLTIFPTSASIVNFIFLSYTTV